MKQIFEHSKSFWVRYSDYAIVEDSNGIKYLKATEDAKPDIYDPTDSLEEIVVKALNVGRVCMGIDRPEEEKNEAVYQFVKEYGLLGLMTALPTTPRFLSCDNVFLPINHFIKRESMEVFEYLLYFYPFERPSIRKNGVEYSIEIEGDNDMVALAMMSDGRPDEVHLSFQREYSERIEWLRQQFVDWAFTMTTIFFFYHDYDSISNKGKEFYRQSMAAYDGTMPTYHIELTDKRPMLVWNLNSLLQGIQLMVCKMLTDDDNPVKMCPGCGKAFIAKKPADKYCSSSCEKQKNSGSD